MQIADSTTKDSASGDSSSEISAPSNRVLTIPNIICIVRLIASPGLIAIAVAGSAEYFVVGYIVLHLSDWIDGKLARWLNQRSVLGARLDSISDTVLYVCLLAGCAILKWEIVVQESVWILSGVASYLITSGLGYRKFGRLPSYHTRAAKISQWLLLVGAISLLLDWAVWPLRVAIVAGILTNIETMFITWKLTEWRADVASFLSLPPEETNTDRVE